jgi:CBS domain-containing protein
VKHHASHTKAGLPAVAPIPETVGEIMTREIVSVPVGTSVRDVALLMSEKRISAVPVFAAGGQLVGMVSEGDLLGRNDADRLARRDWWLTILKDGKPALSELFDTLVARPVEEVMCAPVMTIEARAPLHEVAEMLRAYDIKRLPVMLAGRMVGIVSRSDLVRAMASVIPRRASGRSVGGLLSLFAGMMQTDVRPEDASASAIPAVPVEVDRAPVTADGFRALVTASKQAERDDAVAAKQQAKLDQQRRTEAMRQEHLGERAWREELRTHSLSLRSLQRRKSQDRRGRGRLANHLEGRGGRGVRTVGARTTSDGIRAHRANRGIFRRDARQRGFDAHLEPSRSSQMKPRQRAEGLACNRAPSRKETPAGSP